MTATHTTRRLRVDHTDLSRCESCQALAGSKIGPYLLADDPADQESLHRAIRSHWQEIRDTPHTPDDLTYVTNFDPPPDETIQCIADLALPWLAHHNRPAYPTEVEYGARIVTPDFVYRWTFDGLDRLVDAGLASRQATEPGRADRYEVTEAGREGARSMPQPVEVWATAVALDEAVAEVKARYKVLAALPAAERPTVVAGLEPVTVTITAADVPQGGRRYRAADLARYGPLVGYRLHVAGTTDFSAFPDPLRHYLTTEVTR